MLTAPSSITRPRSILNHVPARLNFCGGRGTQMPRGSAVGRRQEAMDEFTTSSLHRQEEVDALCRMHGVVFTKGFTVTPAEEDRSVSALPPAGAVCAHAHALEVGFCYEPRQYFFNEVLSHFGVAPSQLAPNSWRTMAGFLGLCHYLQVEPSVAVFRCFFRPCLLNDSTKSYFSFRERVNGRPFFLPHPQPSASTPWKKSFFLVWSPVPWACPVVWGKPSLSSLAEPTQLTMGESFVKRKLQEAVDRGWLNINNFCHLCDNNDHDSDMAPPLPSPHTNASSAQDPLRLNLRRVSPPVFWEHNTPNVNAVDTSMALLHQLLIQLEKEKALLPVLLDAAKKADTLREKEMKNLKAQLSETNEAVKQEKKNADALSEELKKTKAQLSEANEAARLEKENAKREKKNADARSEELKKMKAQLNEANEAARLEKEKADALRVELKKKAKANVTLKEEVKEIMDKCTEITNRSDL